MAQLEFAIELGSTNTAIYKRGSGIVLLEPTRIAINTEEKKNQVKAVGLLAKKMQGKTASNVQIVSPVEGGIITDFTLCKKMLTHFMKKVMPKSTVKPKVKILFVVPCGLTTKEKTQYKNLGYYVGASKVEFVENVLAALIGSGYNTNLPSGVISLNLGGGSFSVASVSLNAIIAGYTISMGGQKVDQAIRQYVLDAYELEISMQLAEKIKREIGSLYIHDTSNLEVSGIDVNTKSPRQDVIFSSNIRRAIEYFFEKVVGAIEDVLNNSSPDIVADIANNGIYVTGGLGNITGLENYLKKRLRLPVYLDEKPEEATILGAGKLLSDKKTLSAMIKEN
jgi:rod shape-determining protein MreB